MFEDLIAQLEEIGVTYTEDYDNNTLVVDISTIDKMQLVSVIQAINESMMTFTIDDNSITVNGGGESLETPTETEGVSAEETALNDMFGE